jgi:DSF synthase
MTFLHAPTLDRVDSPRSFADPAEMLRRASYDMLETRLEADSQSLWTWMRAGPKPCFTHALLNDILAHQATNRGALDPASRGDAPAPYRWYVFGSRMPGIFNLGGDLAFFAECIRARDLTALREYGYLCVETIFGNNGPFPSPVVSIAMVQGDALGGGFECALACDVIIAERSAKFGLPEVLFNLFPGMGAYSFLARRLGTREAERIISSGKLYTADEMLALGVVDVVAEDGAGEAAVREHIASHDRRFNATQGLYRTRRRVNPVTLQELRDVVDIWADTAMGVSDLDLRKMLRLTQAQGKRLEGAAVMTAPAVAAE